MEQTALTSVADPTHSSDSKKTPRPALAVSMIVFGLWCLGLVIIVVLATDSITYLLTSRYFYDSTSHNYIPLIIWFCLIPLIFAFVNLRGPIHGSFLAVGILSLFIGIPATLMSMVVISVNQGGGFLCDPTWCGKKAYWILPGWMILQPFVAVLAAGIFLIFASSGRQSSRFRRATTIVTPVLWASAIIMTIIAGYITIHQIPSPSIHRG